MSGKRAWTKVVAYTVALAAALYVQDTYGRITLEDEAWYTACDIAHVCDEIIPPTVVRSNTFFDYSLIGVMGTIGVYLRGEPYVYVRKDLTAAQEFLVTVHEMTHYINDVKGLHHDDSCANEASAFAASDKAAIRIAREDLQFGESWRSRYRGCEPKSP